MEKNAKTQPSRLMRFPMALQKALEQSANQVNQLADAFWLTVPSIPAKGVSGVLRGN